MVSLHYHVGKYQLAHISSAAWRRLALDLATQKRRFQEIQSETALCRMEMGDHSEEENVILPEWWWHQRHVRLGAKEKAKEKAEQQSCGAH